MNGIYLLLGSNIEDRLANLKEAITLIGEEGITIVNRSAVYETAPWGKLDQNWFLNVGLQINTDLDPIHLLKSCQEVEGKMGRKRMEKWGPRVIDVDILYYENHIIQSDKLSIPHPGIPDRKFTLVLLDELAPNEKHPLSNKSHSSLLKECEDNSVCLKTNYRLNIELD